MQKRIRIVVIFGTISLIGLIITQIYWVQRAFSIHEKELDQSIQIALINVARDMAAFSEIKTPNSNPVVQLSANYFVVNINDKIDANVLEHFLSREFKRNGISLDYEYGIYDCVSDVMVYGNYITFDEKNGKKNIIGDLPKYDDYIYYFGVGFPSKTSFLRGDYNNWLFSTLILMIVILFFSLTLYIILKQKRLSEVQKDFINNMTHEFKTPISTIKVSSEVLSSPGILSDPSRVEKYVNIIKSENDRLQQQVDQVLRMADIETETSRLNKEEIEIHEILREIGEQMEARLVKLKGSISYDLSALDSKVYADKLHLKNVISNLIDNAIKYSPEKVEINIRTKNEAKGLVLEVEDKGIGISKDQQKRIFDKFYRVPKGNIHNVKGFGLGLNYVWNVVKNHHWKIDVESTINEGSKFILSIPQ